MERGEAHVELVNGAQLAEEAEDEQVLDGLDLRENVLHFLAVDVVVLKEQLEQLQLEVQQHLEVELRVQRLHFVAEVFADDRRRQPVHERARLVWSAHRAGLRRRSPGARPAARPFSFRAGSARF